MLTNIEKNGKPITESDIQDLEASLNADLPQDYKNFLLKFNGGCPIESNIDFDGSKIKVSGESVKRFYGIDDKPANNILHKAETLKDNLPSKTIFIANTHAGNFFILSLRNDSFGKIYYKDHEIEDSLDFNPNTDSLPESIVFVANTFTEFLDELYDPDDV